MVEFYYSLSILIHGSSIGVNGNVQKPGSWFSLFLKKKSESVVKLASNLFTIWGRDFFFSTENSEYILSKSKEHDNDWRHSLGVTVRLQPQK